MRKVFLLVGAVASAQASGRRGRRRVGGTRH